MRKNGRIGLASIFVTLSLAFGVPTTADPAAGSGGAKLSVGEFLVLYAHSIKLNVSSDASGEMARQALLAAGVRLPGDLDLHQPLTQGQLVRIGELRGVRLTTATPHRRLDRGDAEMFLRAFAEDSRTPGTATASPGTSSGPTTAASTGGRSSNPPGDPAGHAGDKGRGKRKGRPFASPTEPEPEPDR